MAVSLSSVFYPDHNFLSGCQAASFCCFSPSPSSLLVTEKKSHDITFLINILQPSPFPREDVGNSLARHARPFMVWPCCPSGFIHQLPSLLPPGNHRLEQFQTPGRSPGGLCRLTALSFSRVSEMPGVSWSLFLALQESGLQKRNAEHERRSLRNPV